MIIGTGNNDPSVHEWIRPFSPDLRRQRVASPRVLCWLGTKGRLATVPRGGDG
jgi:hypothetical protein